MPLTHHLGLIPAYNVLTLLAPALASFTAFVLCRYITGAFWPSMIGGVMFGFSPYMQTELLSSNCGAPAGLTFMRPSQPAG